MEQLFIPEIGTEIILAENWQFTLHNERRNEKLGKKFGLYRCDFSWILESEYPSFKESFNLSSEKDHKEYREKLMKWRLDAKPFQKENVILTLVKGTILKIDRIYIRKGNKDFSSITFWIKSGEYKGQRFWAKLSDCNTIVLDNGYEKSESCPCKYLDEPCHPRCTCKNGCSSLGCRNCCSYGSLGQRKERAKEINEKLKNNE